MTRIARIFAVALAALFAVGVLAPNAAHAKAKQSKGLFADAKYCGMDFKKMNNGRAKKVNQGRLIRIKDTKKGAVVKVALRRGMLKVEVCGVNGELLEGVDTATVGLREVAQDAIVNDKKKGKKGKGGKKALANREV